MLVGTTGHLDGCWAKVSRAKEHLAQLEREFTPGPNNDLYKSFTEHERDTGKYILTARIADATFVRWAVIVGEVVHDLHSALDHMVCAIARRADPLLDCARLEFPIFTTPLKPGERRPKLIGMRNPEAEAVIESIQPHVAGDGTKHPLWTLYRLSVRDKHREILLGVLSLQVYADAAPPGQAWVPPTTSATGERLQDGTVVLRVTVAHPRGVDMQREPALLIRFDQPPAEQSEPFSGLPVLRVIDDCIRIVEDAISQLARFVA